MPYCNLTRSARYYLVAISSSWLRPCVALCIARSCASDAVDAVHGGMIDADEYADHSMHPGWSRRVSEVLLKSSPTAERTPSGRVVHSVPALWRGSRAASSSRLVVPVFNMAR